MTHRVVVLGLAPVVGYDLVIPPQVFGQATDQGGRRLYDVAVASLDGAPLDTESGYAITPSHDTSVLAEADTVVIPGTRISGPRFDGTLGEELAAALALVPRGARWMSICTGAFVLGAAGLLDGRRATTHWAYAEDFRRLYPRVRLDEGVLFADEGDVLTSAGLSAGIDLCLHVVRGDHGTAVANAVARHLVVPPWRDGGQAQFIERQVPARTEESTAGVREWALERLDESLDVPRLAQRASMSVRTFTRRFHAETGHAPGAWVTQQRVRHAQHLLEATDLAVDEIARRSGLGSAASLRQHLTRTVGVSPTTYRRTFRGPA